MSRWFRFYADAMRNPKVMRLADNDFRLWVRLLAVASENEGQIPALADLKLLLNARLDRLEAGLSRLIEAGLIDVYEPLQPASNRPATGQQSVIMAASKATYEPHNWGKFQYKSDTSTPRVTLHRAKRNVTVTPPDTEADTEQKEETIADAMDGKPSPADDELQPVDLKAVLFSTGVAYLTKNGTTERNARSMLGKWRQQYGDGAVVDAMHLAQSEACSNPIPMITKILERKNGKQHAKPASRGDGLAQSFAKHLAAVVMDESRQGADDPWGDDDASPPLALIARHGPH